MSRLVPGIRHRVPSLPRFARDPGRSHPASPRRAGRRRSAPPVVRRATLAVVAALALLASAGCSSKAGSTDQDGTAADGVRMGEGVTEETITLGALTDLTGAYASLGASITQAQQLHVRQVNAEGGVCDRELKLTVRDHGYDAGKAIPAYTELQPKVLGFPQFLGSPFVNAVRERIDERDKPLVMPMAWSSELLGSDHLRMIGATYDIEAINAIDFLVAEHGLGRGDRLGHVYFEGDYGENALQGAEHAAEQTGLELVRQKIKPTDDDMSAQVAALKQAGVDAVLLSAGPSQAASLVGVAAAADLDVPIIGNNSAFAPQLLKTQAAGALLERYHVAASTLPIGSSEPGPARLAEEYAAAYPDAVVDNGVIAGHDAMVVFVAALRQACAEKDLTRQGVTRALLSLSDVAGEFGIQHDFTDPREPSTRESFVLVPDRSVPGGLRVHRQAATSTMAQEYVIGR